MVKSHKLKVMKNLESALSRIILDGLVWEKTVGKGSGSGIIHVPESLVGKKVKIILIPVDDDDSLSVFKKVIDANADMREHNAQVTKAKNRKKDAEETISKDKEDEEAKIAAADSLEDAPADSNKIPILTQKEEKLEDEDGY